MPASLGSAAHRAHGPSLRSRIANRVRYSIYRYRYLACFTLIGLFSILLELAAIELLPDWWPWVSRAVLAFVAGMTFSLVLNVTVNFHVPRQYLARACAWFALISLFSFGLNAGIVMFLQVTTGGTYGWLRLAIAGALFVIAYTLHRTFTFDQSRNFGIAVYASEAEDVERIFEVVGPCCDHVHVDLVDETMQQNAAPVCLDRIDQIRRLWYDRPICLHVMSRRPRAWVERTWDQVDWYLLHCDAEDDLLQLMFDCRARHKKVGVVWHEQVSTGRLLEFLPHVDFAMVLGVSQPGVSGQSLSPQALAVAQTLESMRHLYHFDLVFDGGVKVMNVARIPGRYIVSASGVLNAGQPAAAAQYLRASRYSNKAIRNAA